VVMALLLIVMAGISGSCKKPPGPGGKATVKGRVLAKDFNNTNSYVLGEYYAPGENVYICYGNNENVANDIKTSADGSFQFRFLNKGHYKVFVTSADTSIHVKGADKEVPVQVEFDIISATQTIDLGDLKVNR
ncbi:MAG: hypothetical protein ACJ76F_02715, partial [Bacteroidia bacterium]